MSGVGPGEKAPMSEKCRRRGTTRKGYFDGDGKSGIKALDGTYWLPNFGVMPLRDELEPKQSVLYR
jgi:hypothetical protein